MRSSSEWTTVVFPEGAHGPLKTCIALAESLQRRGARVVMLVEESFAGTANALGFEEVVFHVRPSSGSKVESNSFWKEFVAAKVRAFRTSPMSQLESVVRPMLEEVLRWVKYADDELDETFKSLRPDIIISDQVFTFPATLKAGVPWVRLVDGNPLEIRDAHLPPPYSGLPMHDTEAHREFEAEFERTTREVWNDLNDFVQLKMLPPLRSGEFTHTSPYLNLYVYPAELDYPRSVPLGSVWQRMDSCVRGNDTPFTVPDALKERKTLIYVSLGSLGTADQELMKRLVHLLGKTPHGVILSLGVQVGQLDLPENVYGESFLPQTSVLPFVDAVITHGGNNTVTESFHFGKPMMVLPLFWDQHDNAQRVDELRWGARLPTYSFDDEDFCVTLENILRNEGLRRRARQAGARVAESAGQLRAAELVEKLARLPA